MTTSGDYGTADFTGYRAIPAEGARVGLLTCLHCGAAVLIDPADTEDMPAKHLAWHREGDRG